MSGNELEDKLREDFIMALQCNKCGNVVDDLIGILKRDYVLVLRRPLYCKDCFSCDCSVNYGLTDLYNDAYCVHYQRRVNGMDSANACPHFLSGEEEARKSMARFHAELTDELIYDK